MFVTPAYAQAAAEGGGSGFEAFLPLILIFGVFYILLIRPQQKKMKEHKATLAAIRRGDKVSPAAASSAPSPRSSTTSRSPLKSPTASRSGCSGD